MIQLAYIGFEEHRKLFQSKTSDDSYNHINRHLKKRTFYLILQKIRQLCQFSAFSVSDIIISFIHRANV